MNTHHFIFNPINASTLLNREMREAVEKLIREIAAQSDYHIINLQTNAFRPPHIQIIIDLPRSVSPDQAAQTIKSYSSRNMRPAGPGLWEADHFSHSIDSHLSTINKYIAALG